MTARRLLLWVVAVAATGVFIGAMAASVAGKSTDIDTQLDLYLANGFDDLQSLVSDFRDIQADGVVLIPPGMPEMLFGQGLRCAKWAGFPKEFLAGLVGEMQEGVAVYRLACFEDPKTRDLCFVNADGKMFYRLARPADYSPNWVLLLRLPDFYTVPHTAEEIRAMEEQYDPARVVARYTLIGRKELRELLTSRAAKEDEITVQKLMLDGGSGGTSVTNIKFTMMDTSSNGWMIMELSYPVGFTNDLEIFSLDGGTGLIEGWWTSRVVTNASVSTNYITWLDTTSSNVQTRFYVAGNATVNSVTDPDGDGLTWAQELYLHKSSPTNSDTDGDGLSDYEEVIDLNTDPNLADTNTPSAVIAFPTNNFNWVWVP